MAKINGTSVWIYIGGTLIAGSTSATLNMNVAEIEVTSKDSLGRKEIIPGKTDWSISGDFLDDVGSSNIEFEDLQGYYENRTQAFIQFVDSAGKSYQGFCYLTSVSREAPMEDVVSGSYTFTGTGLLNIVNIT
jgi:predicted secreted protein